MKFKKLIIVPILTLLFSTINVIPAFAALGDNWEGNASGLGEEFAWNDIEASNNGQYLYANKAAGNPKLFKSMDYGNTWSDITPPGYTSQLNRTIAVSADGKKIVTVNNPNTNTEEFFAQCILTDEPDEELCNAKVLISNNYGETWESKSIDGISIESLAISGDGVTQVLLVINFENIDLETETGTVERRTYISKNSGQTWTQKDIKSVGLGEGGSVSGDVAISSDGQKIITTFDYSPNFKVSTNNGDTWSVEKNLPEELNTEFKNGANIFMSRDGSKVYALTERGVYFSLDLGESWQPTGIEDTCTDIDLNQDGSKIMVSCGYYIEYSENSGQTWQDILDGRNFGFGQAIAASQDFSTVAFATNQDIYISHSESFVPNPTTAAAPSGNNDSSPAASTPTPAAKPKVEDFKELIEKIKEIKEENVEEIKPGTIAAAEPLIMRLIEDLPAILKPQIVNIFTEEPVANQVLDIKKALDFLKDIVDKVLVDLPSLVKIGGEIQASRLVVVDNTTLQLVTADGGVLSVQANDGENPIPVDQSGKVQMVRSNGVETKGVGLSPNSEFSVYLFSDPTLLGIGKSDAKGNFYASFMVDKDFPLGNHTLQINGMLANGKTSSISMPVSVVESVETAATQAMTKAVAEVKPTTSNTYIVFLLIMLALIGTVIVFKGPRFIYDQFRQRIE